jgi:HD-like signal output (HDOD) protein/ActR/RegA family two-component response regulator
MTENLRMLFVDDEVKVLDGLRRMLRPMRDQWEMVFAEGGEEALKLMEARPFDVIVSDMRMPGMNGVELLTEVKRRHPQTVRIVLSGQASRETVLKAVGPSHLYLPKPCAPNDLKAAMDRLCVLRTVLEAPRLRGVVGEVECLPSLPTLYESFMAKVAGNDARVDDLGAIVAGDVGMSAKVLHLVNTAFFGRSGRTADPMKAVEFLGLETLKALALTVHVFDRFDPSGPMCLDVGQVCEHSLQVAIRARRIAVSMGADAEGAEQAFIAGLLHDVGKLVLVAKLPEEYGQAITLSGSQGLPLEQAERKILGASHAEVGTYLIGLWGLPGAILEVLAFHHCPRKSQEPISRASALTAVHIANANANAAQSAARPYVATPVDKEYLRVLDLENAEQVACAAAV